MAMRFLTDINLLQSELQNAVIQVLATNPANGKQGQIYYNSADNLLYRYDGTQWGPVGVVYNLASAPGAVVTGLGADGAVTTTNVTGLTLTGYTPVESGYVTAGMTMQQAFAALDEAVKNAVAGGGEVNQNAWSKILVKAQSTAVTAVAGATSDITLSSDAKVDTFTIASGNKWVDINGSGKTVTLGHSLSGVTAGATGDASHVAKVTVDEAGHVTKTEAVAITPDAIGAATLGQTTDDKDTLSLYGVKALANQALTAAGDKVASVSATANKGIVIEGTDTAPTVGIKLDPAEGNIATLSEAGLKVTAPTVNVPVYSLKKDATSTDYAAVYHLTKDGAEVGEAINIPKDLFVESGEIVENPAGQTPGKYLKLVLQNQTDPVYINVADLVDAYTAGNGITISGTNEVAAKVVAANGLSVDANGIKMSLASGDAAGAMSSADFTKLSGIDPSATANTITLNGTATKTPSFYAPTAAGTAGQYLVSGSTGAPTWQALPAGLKKYTAQNGVLTAAGGAWTWSIAQATHGVTAPLVVQLFDASGNMVMADVAVATNGNVTIVINDTASAGTLAANTYRVVIIG